MKRTHQQVNASADHSNENDTLAIKKIPKFRIPYKKQSSPATQTTPHSRPTLPTIQTNPPKKNTAPVRQRFVIPWKNTNAVPESNSNNSTTSAPTRPPQVIPEAKPGQNSPSVDQESPVTPTAPSRTIMTRSKSKELFPDSPTPVTSNDGILIGGIDYNSYLIDNLWYSFDADVYSHQVTQQKVSELIEKLMNDPKIIKAESNAHVHDLIVSLSLKQQLGLLIRQDLVHLQYQLTLTDLALLLHDDTQHTSGTCGIYLMYFPLPSDINASVREAVVNKTTHLTDNRQDHLIAVLDSSEYWHGLAAVGQGVLAQRKLTHERIGKSKYVSPFDFSSSLVNLVRELSGAPIELMIPILSCDASKLFHYECILIRAAKLNVQEKLGGGNYQSYSPQNREKITPKVKVMPDKILIASKGQLVMTAKSRKSTKLLNVFQCKWLGKIYHVVVDATAKTSNSYIWLRVSDQTLFLTNYSKPKNWKEAKKKFDPYSPEWAQKNPISSCTVCGNNTPTCVDCAGALVYDIGVKYPNMQSMPAEENIPSI